MDAPAGPCKDALLDHCDAREVHGRSWADALAVSAVGLDSTVAGNPGLWQPSQPQAPPSMQRAQKVHDRAHPDRDRMVGRHLPFEFAFGYATVGQGR